MTDEIKNQLTEIAALLRSSSRKRKSDPIKQSLLNKGFDTTKEKRKQKRSGGSRYPTRLQQINDARAEAARQRRLSNSEVKAINDETIKVAEERVAQQRKEKFKRFELQKFRSRPMNSFSPFENNNPYSITETDHSIEVVPNRHRDPPVFKNKVEEAIYNLKNKK